MLNVNVSTAIMMLQLSFILVHSTGAYSYASTAPPKSSPLQ